MIVSSGETKPDGPGDISDNENANLDQLFSRRRKRKLVLCAKVNMVGRLKIHVIKSSATVAFSRSGYKRNPLTQQLILSQRSKLPKGYYRFATKHFKKAIFVQEVIDQNQGWRPSHLVERTFCSLCFCAVWYLFPQHMYLPK